MLVTSVVENCTSERYIVDGCFEMKSNNRYLSLSTLLIMYTFATKENISYLSHNNFLTFFLSVPKIVYSFPGVKTILSF